MALLLSETIKDAVRNRTTVQSYSDRHQNKERKEVVEVPNQTLHGITPNGTYFFCSLVYKKDVTRHNEPHLLKLIDAYANTDDHIKHIRLKNEIRQTCGEDVEGIALLFSTTKENKQYGFVSGKRVQLAQWRGKGPIALDADELFSGSELNTRFHAFILENDSEDASEHITQYIQGDEQGDTINTDVINAIKYVTAGSATPETHLTLYLKTICSAIQNAELKQRVEDVYNALEALPLDYCETRDKATALTVQLLHSQDNEARKQLLVEYDKLALDLYNSTTLKLMKVGIAMIILSIALLSLVILPASPILTTILGISSAWNLVTGLLCTKIGWDDYKHKNATAERDTANKFFKLTKNIKENIPEEIPQDIPEYIKPPEKR